MSKSVNVSIEPRNVIYASTIRGATQEATGRDTLYYGKTFRVKRDEFGAASHLAVERAMAEEIHKDAWLPAGSVFPADGEIERFEVFDPDTGDILVMYRVPAQNAEDDTIPVLPDLGPGVEVRVMGEDDIPAPPDELLELWAQYTVLLETEGAGVASKFVADLQSFCSKFLAQHNIFRGSDFSRETVN